MALGVLWVADPEYRISTIRLGARRFRHQQVMSQRRSCERDGHSFGGLARYLFGKKDDILPVDFLPILTKVLAIKG